jgi:RimJ/RimL family protein N-acetyltransferase
MELNDHVVRLRPAELSDEELLLEWRNEPTTRAASLSPGKVSTEDHRRWLAARLDDTRCALFIILADAEPIGQVRLDRLDDELAEVSIGLAPEARGRGAGREALRLAAAEARSRLGVRMLTARIKADNGPSLRSFAAAGFTEVRRERDLVELRRPIAQETATR